MPLKYIIKLIIQSGNFYKFSFSSYDVINYETNLSDI